MLIPNQVDCTGTFARVAATAAALLSALLLVSGPKSAVAAPGVLSHPAASGVTLLEQAQISANASSVYVQAVDGYGATISIEDAQNEKTILAYQKDGEALTLLSSGGEGPVRLIMGADQYAQRWVRGVSVIEVS